VLPGPITSDHPGVPFGYCGPWWVANVVDAIGKSPFWNSTAIFIFWDDWGGFYDHVSPYVVRDVAGPGFRVPLLVVSPFARRGAVVHTNTEFATLTKFTEENFGLASLGATDTSPYLNNLNAFFDFSSPKPFVPVQIPPSIVCNDTARQRATRATRSKWLKLINDRD
jgi:phospholipase C